MPKLYDIFFKKSYKNRLSKDEIKHNINPIIKGILMIEISVENNLYYLLFFIYQ